MEIKTITSPRDAGPAWFDEKVNAAMAEGFRLARRDMLPGGTFGSNTYQPAYYAELVKPDEPKPRSVFDALAEVKEFCGGHRCDSCPLGAFCAAYMAPEIGPVDWKVPEEPEGQTNDPA